MRLVGFAVRFGSGTGEAFPGADRVNWPARTCRSSAEAGPGTILHRGTEGSNPPPSANESVSAGSRGRYRPQSRLWRRSGPASGREKGRGGCDRTRFGPVSLTGIDAVPLRQSSGRAQRPAARDRSRGLRHISRLCGSTCEQSALLGPVQGQIEFGQTRCGQLDGLPALQDRFDQLRAQEGKTNKPADVASGDTVTLGVVSERPCADERRLQPNERLCVSRSTSALPDLPRSGPPAE